MKKAIHTYIYAEDIIFLRLLTLAAPADLEGSSNCALYLASLAFKRPKWYSVAVYEVREEKTVVGII